MSHHGQSQFNNRNEQFQEFSNSYNNTNVRMGLLKGGNPDAEVFCITSEGFAITNSVFRVLTNFNFASTGFDITTPSLSGVQFTIASTDVNDVLAGTGAEVVRLTGLDVNWNDQSEDVVLNGTTPVNTVATNWIRINRMLVIQSANGANTSKNVGYINLSDSTDTFTVGEPDTRIYCAIGQDWNFSSHGIFSVKAGYSWVPTHFKVSTDATTAKGIQMIPALKFFAIPEFNLVHLDFANAGVNYQVDAIPTIPEKSDVILRAKASTASTINRCVCWFGGLLKRNAAFPNSVLWTKENLQS